jgi:hypothetical protein
MKKTKCISCSERKNCRDNYTSWIFFIIGLVATVAVRVVNVLTHLKPLYGKIAWYIGVSGFLLFFIYKFKVNQVRSRFITQKKLVDKVGGQEPLNKDDYRFISNLLCSLSSRKERINYLFIFILSALALLLAIYMDFLPKGG